MVVRRLWHAVAGRARSSSEQLKIATEFRIRTINVKCRRNLILKSNNSQSEQLLPRIALSRSCLSAASHGNANVKMSLPAAIATYCFELTAYVIGDALMSCPVWKCQSGFPVAASTASKDCASSPKKTSPPAVVITPADECPSPD